jgi:hypothetical protein
VAAIDRLNKRYKRYPWWKKSEQLGGVLLPRSYAVFCSERKGKPGANNEREFFSMQAEVTKLLCENEKYLRRDVELFQVQWNGKSLRKYYRRK